VEALLFSSIRAYWRLFAPIGGYSRFEFLLFTNHQSLTYLTSTYFDLLRAITSFNPHATDHCLLQSSKFCRRVGYWGCFELTETS